MRDSAQIAREIWDEAKTSASCRHGEGLETALNMALNDSRVSRDTAARATIRDLYSAEQPIPRLKPRIHSRARGDSGGLRQVGTFLPRRYRK